MKMRSKEEKAKHREEMMVNRSRAICRNMAKKKAKRLAKIKRRKEQKTAIKVDMYANKIPFSILKDAFKND